MPNIQLNPLLTPQVVAILNKCLFSYSEACKNGNWVNEEIYKFEFAQWLTSRVDFNYQTNEQILDICLESQQQRYTNTSTKGVNFLLSAGNEKRSIFLTPSDIDLFRKAAQGTLLSEKDLENRGISYTGLTGWLGTLFPNQYVPVVALEEVDAIIKIWNLQKHPQKGYPGFVANQEFGKAIVAYIKHYAQEITILFNKQLVNPLNLETLYNWVAQDFTIFIKRRLINQNNFPPSIPDPKPGPPTKTMTIQYPLNTILFGPPGTGKTYNTKQYAIQLIENLSEEECSKKYPDRQSLNARFDLFQDRKQIEFVTFHQSFTYEDFIEGIKPVLPKTNGNEEIKEANSGKLTYEIADGIFKTICERAESYMNYTPENQPESFKTEMSQGFQRANFYKMSIGNTANSEDDEIYQYCIENGCIALGWGGEIDFRGVNNRKDIKDRLDEEGVERSPYESTAVKMFVVDMKPGDFVFISSGNFKIRAIAQISGGYYFQKDSPIRYSQFREVKWLITNINLPVTEVYNKAFSQQTIYGLNKNLINQDYFQTSAVLPNKEEFHRNHVLVIDEINRGNVSQIFGELITLIESDKRSGDSESLMIKLPYSKEDFSVPNNLYIIGTMNTADRSVEALDTALRRRFSFVEMPPQYELPEINREVEGYNLANILQKINQRIEKLLSKDNLIGHSYFMTANSLKDLRAVFQYKIIPLLQEYFFGDFGKIGLVLGEGFFQTSENTDNNIFATFRNYDPSGLAEKEVYHLINVLDEKKLNDNQFKAALDALV
ncbi:AAA family ATPase [Adhaeribacter sp. BT258]|uniref:AAA family ATPase n=1 Tax=Adhaeribacter terrigena TaxID=2793070 RepID=A0ABS1C148_9BACT|nr:AAA family ATPase [Adhaeribacter terrigena]MBK0403064.1 AAA family ATPase [Adhaeribacter terrigena]